MDTIEDTRTRTLIDVIKTLPTKYSVPLMMQGVLDMSIREIAEYHRTAKTNIQRVLQYATDLLKAAIHAQ
jgi:DNA-directed RNA polymerase specialized sigma24 family protein